MPLVHGAATGAGWVIIADRVLEFEHFGPEFAHAVLQIQGFQPNFDLVRIGLQIV